MRRVRLTTQFDRRMADLKPGTILMREWNAQAYRVMVVDDGFAWNGKTYDSLSKIAFAITGTKWNGPRFFGLETRSCPRPSHEHDSQAEGPLRNLYACFDRGRARSGLQLAGCPI